MTEINGRKVAADWSLPREVYQEMKESEEPEVEEEEEEESEKEIEMKEENEISEVTLLFLWVNYSGVPIILRFQMAKNLQDNGYHQVLKKPLLFSKFVYSILTLG